MSGPIGSSQWMYSSGAAGFYSYSIDQSLRFNDNDSAKLSRTPSSDGNRQTFTISFWMKRANIGIDQMRILNSNFGSDAVFDLYFEDTDEIVFRSRSRNTNGATFDWSRKSVRKFRDVSSWYHIVIAVDVTVSSPSSQLDLFNFYLNGENITSNFTNVVNSERAATSSQVDQRWNSTTTHDIGYNGSSQYFDGYLAEFHNIDGTALSPTSFGETINGVWVPKAYSGSYGTNGFYLPFDDSSAIGDDESGNTNDFTASNLAASDVVLDSPVNNWCTNNGAMRANITHSEGNLKMVGVGGNFDSTAGTFLFDVEDADGWYWEGYVNSGGTELRFGISKPQNIYFNQSDPTYNYAHSSDGISYSGNGNAGSGGSYSSYGDTFTTGDVIGIAVKAGAIYFYKNGTIQNSGTAAATGLTGQYVPAFAINSTLSLSANYGQDSTFAGTLSAGGNSDANGLGDFKYSVPSSSKSLCSANLPEPTIGPNSAEQADDYFNTVLYTGDSDNDVTVTNTFAADWVWIKSRSRGDHHFLQDTVRGFGGSKSLSSSSTGTEGYNGGAPSSQNIVTTDSSLRVVGADFATNSATYVAWNWKAGGTAVSNTDGSITSSVSAAPDAGFSIISWTGAGADGTIGHGLTKTPEFFMTKNRDSTRNWEGFHKDLTTGYVIYLNLTNGQNNAGSTYFQGGYSAATSSVISLSSWLNLSAGHRFIGYAFHSVPGYSAVGSYVGNGSSDGTFVYTGFRPAWIMTKRTNSTSNWLIIDVKRDIDNVAHHRLIANSTNTEATSVVATMDILSNGFKRRDTNTDVNASGGTYVYLAFAEAPFKYANAR
jgi:hypothetical protein